jgi:hypothetical protein
MKIRIGDGDVGAAHRLRSDRDPYRGANRTPAYSDVVANADPGARTQGTQNDRMIDPKSGMTAGRTQHNAGANVNLGAADTTHDGLPVELYAFSQTNAVCSQIRLADKSHSPPTDTGVEPLEKVEHAYALAVIC